MIVVAVIFAFYGILWHIEKKWKYDYKTIKAKEKEKTRRIRAISKGFVRIIQSNDSVRRIKIMFFRNKIDLFDKFKLKKKELIDKYEDMVIDALKEEVIVMSSGEKTPVRKSNKGKRMKNPKKKRSR